MFIQTLTNICAGLLACAMPDTPVNPIQLQGAATFTKECAIYTPRGNSDWIPCTMTIVEQGNATFTATFQEIGTNAESISFFVIAQTDKVEAFNIRSDMSILPVTLIEDEHSNMRCYYHDAASFCFR